MREFNSVLAGFGTTVFEVMSRLAKEHQTINLGQGFPDEEGPGAMLEALDDAMNQEKLDKQRAVVRNERRQSYENRPYGMARLKT